MKKAVSVSLCIIICLCFSVLAYADIKLPSPENNYINDFAGVLNTETEEKIMLFAAELEEKTTVEVSVVTIHSLDGNEISMYANELFRSWGIGDKEKNNGALLLVAVEDRKSRIEVGYGLEGCLTDSITGRIQDEYLLPHLKNGDYNTGILHCTEAIINTVSKEYGVELTGVPKDIPVPQGDGNDVFNPLGLLGVILFFVFDGIFLGFRITKFMGRMFVLGSIYRGRNNYHGRGGFGGGFGGGSSGGFGGGSSGGGGSSRGW